MINIGLLLGMICVGAIMGLCYFGGLWLTLNKLSGTKQWGLWLAISFLVRSSLTVTAFWLFAAGDWQRILAMAVGFSIVRFLTIKQIQQAPLPS